MTLRTLFVAPALAVALAACATDEAPPADQVETVEVGGFELGAPVTHAGLTICPVYRRDRESVEPHGEYLTLPVALEKGLVTVREVSAGGDVPQLLLDNAADVPVLLCAGDVVKGGKQDRVLAQDVVVEAGKEGVSLDVFCVQHGRWSQGDQGLRFSFGGKAQADLKRVVQAEVDQSATWREVARLNLANSISAGMELSDVTGSYMVSLGADEIRAKLEPYLDRFAPVLKADADVVGLVVAYEGKPVTLELYSHPRLFAQARDETLRSFVLDALSRWGEKGPKGAPADREAADREAMQAFLREALEAREEAGSDDALRLRGVNGAAVFQTKDRKGAILHCNAYAK